MKDKVFAFGAILACAFALTGCPLLVPATSGPGWIYDFGHRFTLGHRVTQRGDGSFMVSGSMQAGPGEIIRTFGGTFAPDGSEIAIIDSGTPLLRRFTDKLELATPGPDNSVYVVGSTDDADDPSSFGFLRYQRYTADGANVFDLTLNGISYVPTTVHTAPNGNLLVATALTDESRTTDTDVLWEIDPFGDIVNQTTLTEAHMSFISMKTDNLSKVVLGGEGFAGGGNIPNAALWVPGQNSAADILVEHDLGGDESIRSLGLTPDGGYVLVGETNANGVLIKLAADGSFLWSRTDFLEANETNQSDDVWDVAVTPEGLIALVGSETRVVNIIGTFPVISRETFVVLLDAGGNLIWRTNIPNIDLYGITHTQQNTFMTCGATGDFLTLVEVDINGNIVN